MARISTCTETGPHWPDEMVLATAAAENGYCAMSMEEKGPWFPDEMVMATAVADLEESDHCSMSVEEMVLVTGEGDQEDVEDGEFCAMSEEEKGPFSPTELAT